MAIRPVMHVNCKDSFNLMNINYYYVNNEAQANGDHEVHKLGCSFIPWDTTLLGQFSNCAEAIEEAKKSFRHPIGCFYCSNKCHTS